MASQQPHQPRRLVKVSASPACYTSAGWGAFPARLRLREARLLVKRRRLAFPDLSKAECKALPRVGLALSGGGIRSATFSLGILQALARLGQIPRVDYLSTVSGGGYVGTFLGALYQSRHPDAKKAPVTRWNSPDLVQKQLLRTRDMPIRFLRENGRYLTPGGSGDALLAGGVTLRNFAALQLVLGLFALMVFLGMDLFRISLDLSASRLPATVQRLAAGSVITGAFWWSPWFLFPALIFLIWVVPTGWAYWLVHRWKVQHPGWPPLLTMTGIGLLGALAMAPGHPWLTSNLAALFGGNTRLVCSVVTATSLLTLGYFGAATGLALWRNARDKEPDEDLILGPRRRLSEWLRLGLLATLLGLYAASLDSLAQSAYAAVAIEAERASHGMWRALVDLGGQWIAMLAAPLAFLIAKGRPIVEFMEKRILPKDRTPSVPWGLVAGLGAILLATVLLLAVAFTEKGIAWGWKSPLIKPEETHQRLPTPEAKESHKAISLHPKLRKPAGPPVEAPQLVPAPQPVPNPEPTESQPTVDRMLPAPLTVAFVIVLLLSLAVGHTYEFLNLSSLGPYYSSMLTRAYLGASNWVRHAERRNPGFVVAGDDIFHEGLPDCTGYAPHTAGGPLHLVNVCLNETFGGESDVNQRDRHGLGLAVGPASYSVGVNHHAIQLRHHADAGLDERPEGAFGVFHVKEGCFSPEILTMGRWMSISGAAASTGMGMRTSPGLSLLCGVFNVRLGYWWDSGVGAGNREGEIWRLRWSTIPRLLFPVQCHLLDEFAAHFPGTSRQKWYLSDGGHFENLGAYELIRRRIPLIIVVDASADPDYAFEDLNNLVRKARTDFGAEISFLDSGELDQLKENPAMEGWSCIGPLEHLRRGKEKEGVFQSDQKDVSKVHAALARIRYDTPLPGPALGAWEKVQRETCHADGAWMLYIKPTLRKDADLPLDVIRYHETHAAFPHETTGDQFFDEAQWESYRRLGEFIGLHVLGVGREEDSSSWTPGPFWNLGPTCHPPGKEAQASKHAHGLEASSPSGC
ncbi:hypothetical protein GETHLI_28500 [Geothrix limicola]|uniref:PNPLA domain-containing protein n=1 Tax=Geothrix limicola TaxID=2927978 RepID=A0ABQ5QI32_9BACT|nr:patatin-like phospholipase family protein [Geothrix limicola]GLH74348.1 hypothetical protein GETHLI_28500 [Geothrix limicola]